MPFKLSNVGELETLIRQIGVKVDSLLLKDDVESMLTDYDLDYAYLIGFKSIPSKATVNEWNIDTTNGVATANNGIAEDLTSSLTNPSFEEGNLTGWSTVNNEFIVTNAWSSDGTYSAGVEYQITTNPYSPTGSIVKQDTISQTFSIDKSSYYHILLDAYAISGDDGIYLGSSSDTTSMDHLTFLEEGQHTLSIQATIYDTLKCTLTVYLDNNQIYTYTFSTTTASGSINNSSDTTYFAKEYVDNIRLKRYNSILELSDLDTNPIDVLYIYTDPAPGSDDLKFYATDGTNKVQITPNTLVSGLNLNSLTIEALFNPTSTFQLDNMAMMWRRKV